MRFLIFTKTDWAEPPRLRHQLSRLLADAGHEVIFFELPFYPWQAANRLQSGHPRISLRQYRHLLHHKLRLFPTLQILNARYEIRQIKRSVRDLRVYDNDVVVNFNYDYFFLRDLFPRQRLITLINDDFWSRAIWGFERPLKWALGRTCKSSDMVLAVSPTLVEQLKPYCSPQLFYPWADIPYKPPYIGIERSTLLYWGYIGEKIDFDYVKTLACLAKNLKPAVRLAFVGPVQGNLEKLVDLVRSNDIDYYTELDASELQLHEVFGAIIPYQKNVPSIDVITMPNKALQLLCRGVPLLITGMPNFIRNPAVFRLGLGEEVDSSTIATVRQNFYQLQPEIMAFLRDHSAAQRLHYFLRQIENLCAA